MSSDGQSIFSLMRRAHRVAALDFVDAVERAVDDNITRSHMEDNALYGRLARADLINNYGSKYAEHIVAQGDVARLAQTMDVWARHHPEYATTAQAALARRDIGFSTHQGGDAYGFALFVKDGKMGIWGHYGSTNFENVHPGEALKAMYSNRRLPRMDHDKAVLALMNTVVDVAEKYPHSFVMGQAQALLLRKASYDAGSITLSEPKAPGRIAGRVRAAIAFII